MSLSNFNNPLLYIVLIVLLFLALREVMTWYWKTNKVIELLERIEKNTRPGFSRNKKEESSIENITDTSKK